MKSMTRRVADKEIPLDFDYQSTTPCDPEVIDAMAPYWNDFWGNASSRHSRAGLHASAAVSLAREQLTSYLRIKPERLIFTSGATEANNLALLGHARAKALAMGRAGHLITVATEHHSVIDPLRQLQREGFRLTEIKPASDGIVPAEKLKDAFQDDTFLVSVMMANNEIGVVQPLAELTKLCRERGVTFHSDSVQAFGQLPFHIDELGIDLLTFSGHKIYGPKGIGALIIRESIPLTPLQWGGGQEKGIRSGTLPTPLVVGLAKAAEIAFRDVSLRHKNFIDLRNELMNGLRENIPGLIINGSIKYRLPNNLNITVPGVRGHQLHSALRPVLVCSSGSACSNGEPSHVLRAIGRNAEEAAASIRLSLGRNSTMSQVRKAIELITKVVSRLKEN